MVEARPSNLCRQLFGFVVAWVTVSGSPNGTRDPRSQDVALEVLRDIERSTWQLSKDLPRQLSSTFEDPDLGRGLSPRPWFQEVVDRYGAPPRQHPQRYKLHDGRRLSVLMENNTVPIRFHLNFDTLYEEKVQANPYTKDRYCFQEGAWFRIGYPDEKPSGSGPDDCGDRTTTYVTGNKWCICTSNDLISDQMRDFVIHATTEVMKQVPKFFRVNPVEEQLQFRNFEGSYPAMWETTGQTGVCCDPDCQKGLHVVVPDSFCTEGVAADAVLSLSMPPPIPGVGGAGTFCSADQHGRPTHMVFQWHRRITPAQFAQSSTQELVQQWRGLVLHEALHGLGFGSGLWQNSYDGNGQRREIIKQLEVEDEDGSRDFIYHFVKGTRVYEVAKAYFACEEDDQWQGLPLMSWPPSGRDTHHETRILRDDVMSYGNSLEAVSAVTLAALEDTGHYLANYSSAECMWWGKGRGCSFVLQRCSVRAAGEVITGSQASQCNRAWSSRYSAGNREALEKCLLPDCRSRTVGGVTTCDAECFTGDDAEAVCTKVPSGPVEAAGFVGWAQDLVSDVIGYDITWESLQSAASVSMAPFCLLSVCCLAKCFVCPRSKPERSRLFFYVLSVVTVLPGLGICAAGGYVAINWGEFEAFFTVEFMAGVLALGFAVVFIAGLGIYAVYTGDRGKQMCFSVLHTLEVLTLLGTVFMSAKFAMDLDKMTSDTLSQAGAAPTGLTSAGVAQRMADQVMKRLLSLSCRTYQVCCEDTELLDLRVANGAPRQCKVAHEGMADDAGFVLSDPSHPNFCQAVSGINSRTAFPPMICGWVQSPDFSIESCKQEYCTSGLEGLESFLTAGVAIYRENMLHCGLAVGFLLAIQLVQLFVVLCMRSKRRRQSRVSPDGESDSEDSEDLQAVVPKPSLFGSRRGTQVTTINVREKPRLERRISVGSDLAFTGTYTGAAASAKAAAKPR
ncbi:Leishmanolysin (Cell surface protease) (Major surface glycoprotein) (Major surface protease) (Promastigote surface endopeptidase) (Protein gp63) [Durusdinium trenchii]|uniref:Leishmanolysin (Cell surface protease) (Major surface glycoprotein) (Major surface protease) (Promastigote surface endopeptidase) (Protein gp63) n=1 Tax=Durusdinium trenchii TaxID=1381693 RepID=A0ABP0RAE7_9DINO